MKKIFLGIAIGTIIWVPINCIFYYNRTGTLTPDAVWTQTKPALAGVLFLFVLYLILRKIKK